MKDQALPIFKKSQVVAAFVASAAVMIAIPVFIVRVIRLGWELAVASASPRAPAVADKIRQLAASAEARISGQADK